MLTEARVVLPGAQALFGFQLAIVLTQAFEQLPSVSRMTHAASLFLVALAILMLMAPAAYHRIVHAGEDTRDMYRIGSALVTMATAPLALGLAGDIYLAHAEHDQEHDRGGLPVEPDPHHGAIQGYRNLLAHAPQRLHEEVSSDYNDMIYASSAAEIEVRRRAFIRKWRLKCKPVADSLEEAGERLFTFTRLPVSQWKSARTTNAIERLHEEFKRRIKTQTVLPSGETAAMLFWALLTAGQITMRKVDGWQTLTHKFVNEPVDLAA